MKNTLILAALVLFFVSCNDDDVDTTKPTIEIH